MTIREIIDNSKKDQDITGIKVSIENQNQLDYFDNPTEVYYGELSDIPNEFLEQTIISTSHICLSSDESRVGSHVLLINYE